MVGAAADCEATEFLVRERAVHFGGIEECDAAFDRGPEKSDHLCLVCSRTVREAHAHAAEPDAETSRLVFPSLRFCIVSP